MNTQLTPFVESMILEVLESVSGANQISTACEYAGVNVSTFNSWMRRGAVEEDGVYRDLYAKVKHAEAFAESGLVTIIKDAAPSDWRAAAHILERRWPGKWAKHDHVSIDQNTEFTVRWKNEKDIDEVEVDEGVVQNELAMFTTEIAGKLISGAD